MGVGIVTAVLQELHLLSSTELYLLLFIGIALISWSIISYVLETIKHARTRGSSMWPIIGMIIAGIAFIVFAVWHYSDSRNPPKTPPKTEPILSSPESGKEAPIVDVALRFISPKSPALMIKNLSDPVARDIRWMVGLWNMDLPDRQDPLPIPSQTVGWIRGHDEVGPQSLFSEPLVVPLLQPGNRLFGSASVDCPTCSKARTYVVYIVWGQGGWVSEVETAKYGVLVPKDPLTKKAWEMFFRRLDALSPANTRLPIGEYEPHPLKLGEFPIKQ